LSDLNEIVRSGLPIGVLSTLERNYKIPKRKFALNHFKLFAAVTYVRADQVIERQDGEMGLVFFKPKLSERVVIQPSDSERIERYARFLAIAKKVFGTMPRALDFLSTEHDRLGGRTPLACLSTELGGREVEAILDSIAFGLPA
jgi:hypothetical protein